MSSCVPSILILGHSFVRRLRDDLDAHFDARAASNFHLPESGYITLLGTGGRTVEKVVKYDLQSVHKYKPDIVILELGTNDLSTHASEVVGSKIDDLVHALRHTYNVRVVGVCQVINRNIPFAQGPDLGFNAKAAISLLRKMGFLLGIIGNFFETIVHCYPPMACIVMPKDSTVCIGVIVGLS